MALLLRRLAPARRSLGARGLVLDAFKFPSIRNPRRRAPELPAATSPLARTALLEPADAPAPASSSAAAAATGAVPIADLTRLRRVATRIARSRPHAGQLEWGEPPRTVLIIKKPGFSRPTTVMRTVARWLARKDILVLVEPAVAATGECEGLAVATFRPDQRDRLGEVRGGVWATEGRG